MKYLSSLFIIFVFVTTANGQRDSLAATNPIILAIQKMDFSTYIGKPIDSLIQDMPAGYAIAMRGSVVSKKAAYLILKYAPSTSVWIAVRDFQHMNPELVNTSTPMQNWDLNLFRQEAASFVVAFNGSCFNGCGDKYRLN